MCMQLLLNLSMLYVITLDWFGSYCFLSLQFLKDSQFCLNACYNSRNSRSQSDLSLAQSSASVLLLKYRLLRKIIFYSGSLEINFTFYCTNITSSENHPSNVYIDLYIYGQLIINVFETSPVISDFVFRRSWLQISAIRSSVVTESCVALVDRYREMTKTSHGRTAIFHILRSSLFVNNSTLQAGWATGSTWKSIKD